MTSSSSKKAPSWVGLKIGNTAYHMTVTWFGKHRTSEELAEISADWEALRRACNGSIAIEFGEWKVLGKPEDIKAGKGLDARSVKIIDSNVEDRLVAFHRKWYCHEDGEAEERKLRPSFHVTARTQEAKSEISTWKDADKCATFLLR